MSEDYSMDERQYDSLSANQKRKLARREQKELERALAESSQTTSGDWLQQVGFDEEYLREERLLGLQKNRNLQNWMENLAPEGTLEAYEKRSSLPAGATKTMGQGFEEIAVPAAKRLPPPQEGELINISSLLPWARKAFADTKQLNRLQSAVFNCAFNSAENMLVCAPTGAGKTNVALLTVLQLLKSHIDEHGKVVDMQFKKIIYIAPMKALAQEVVAKFSERLAPLKLVVKEYTGSDLPLLSFNFIVGLVLIFFLVGIGDTQLSKQELMESHVLVCTPEKYDSATRKGGDGSLGTLVSLIIIDEVHLLADERGAVIETIVARTLRYVESSQRVLRIVGLSATLPNYRDVASFLGVNAKTGLFFFGSEFRPIPLDQTFIGLTDKQRPKRQEVMIFVHARRETSKTLEAMLELCSKYCTYHLLENVNHEKYTLFKRQVDKSRSSEVQQLFYSGVGVHHAGLLRSDRSLVEQLFECGLIKVLCCTATLAWGVNLPAHTVIIKGTEMYDPERGGFVDLSVLDIVQIFGRAGRPQYDNSGHAILITQQKSLNTYLGLLAQQTPIESAMVKSLVEHMNAEIVNGTINNIKEAIVWLSYTFLFVRMKKNPLIYGIKYEDIFDDPQLDRRRRDLAVVTAETLDQCMMARYDKRSGNLATTDLGRIASHYYIKHSTIESFNRMLSPHLLHPEALHLLCSSAEFDQLKSRPEELSELDELKKSVFVKVKGAADETSYKVNVLLQAFLGQSKISSFTLQSDSNYVAQNGSRISRALFEICLKRGWATLARYYLTVSKSIDRRMRWDCSPLRQLVTDDMHIPKEVFKRLEDSKVDHIMLLEMQDAEIGQLVHNHKVGGKLLLLARQLPRLHIEPHVQPITKGIIRLKLEITAPFDWVDRLHGFAEPFWIWIEDSESEYIYHAEHIMIQKRTRHDVQVLEVTIPVSHPMPSQYFVRVISDIWVGCETVTPVPFNKLSMPDSMGGGHTSLHAIHPIPKAALRNARYEALYGFSHFNPVQSEAFHALYHTDRNVLVGAPTGSGKTVFAELAILRLLNMRGNSKSKIVYVAPLRALAKERLRDWQKKLGKGLGLSILELTGEVTPDIQDLHRADILIVTPEKWDSISRGWRKREYVSKVALMIIDEIHLLGVDRGPVLEVIVSRTRFISSQTGQAIRFLGLSTALANARDLGDWLGIEESHEFGAVGLYNFRPSVRPVPMTIHIQGFPGKHYCPRMATMNKPAYAAILEHSPRKPVLIFVSSRRQTRLTALDLISYCAADDEPKRFLHLPDEEMLELCQAVKDKALKDCLLFGIGIHHAGLDNNDRVLVEELFLNNKIQVLVCTSTLAWGVNLPCHLVIVKGTEYFDAVSHGYVDFPVTDILQMIGRAGRPQFDSTAVAYVLEYLTWTYLYRRLLLNPSYYGLTDSQPQTVRDYLMSLVERNLLDLHKAGCLTISDFNSDVSKGIDSISKMANLSSTTLGVVASYYYLRYRTPAHFLSKFRLLVRSKHHEDRQWLVWQVLKALCDAEEFSKLPVRHNEDSLNAELAHLLGTDRTPIPLNDMLSPHVKTFLLLVAHMQHQKLPITDYINDLKTVLDQVPRLLNAMIDIAAEEGFLLIVYALISLNQSLVQATYIGSEHEELSQLPALQDPLVLAAMLNSLAMLDCPPTVKGLRSLGQSKVNETLNFELQKSGWAFRESSTVVNRIMRTVFTSWPLIRRMNLRLRESSSENWIAVPSQRTSSMKPSTDMFLEVTLDQAASSRRDRRTDEEIERAENDQFVRIDEGKQQGWWLLLTAQLGQSEELLALRRVSCQTKLVPLYFTTPSRESMVGGKWTLKITSYNTSIKGIDDSLEVEVSVD
eukprot:scaffold5974_cov158-Ochromonas_danica.AAC.6